MKQRTRKISVNRLKKWIKGEEAGPVRIDIEPTACCNLECKFCWQRDEKRLEWCDYDDLISQGRLVEIVKEASALGVKEWQVAGGWEPTANMEKTYPMLKEIKKHDMYGCLTTNGVGFTEDQIKKLVELGWDQILFSVEGPDSRTHDSLTQVKGSFEKVKRNVNLFKKYKEELGKKKPEYSVHAVLNSKNYDKMKEMIEIGHRWGCTGVNFEPMLPWSEEAEKIKLSEKQQDILDYYIDEALEKAEELGMHTNLRSLKGRKDLVDKDENSKEVLEKSVEEKEKNIVNAPCYVPWLSLEIRVSGKVVSCRLNDNDAGAPEVHERSLEDIWFGEYFESLRENMAQRNLPEYCSTCASGDIVDQEELRKRLKESDTINKIKDMVR
ncbi:MAG: radical SAM protein [Candidatus Aenigmatarchaeota archaeon]